ncbi:hypothetical protein [Methylorubrum populi]
MTPAATPEALAEALARSAIEAKFGPEGVSVIFDTPDEATDHQRAVLAARAKEARRVADFAIAGPLAPLLAAHQQVTAERDEDRAELAQLRAEGEAKDRALKLCLAELDWQVSAAEHCGDPDRECPMQDIGKPCGEHAQAQDAARTALARAATAREG